MSPRGLQPDLRVRGLSRHRLAGQVHPLPIGHGHDALAQHREHLLNEPPVARKAHLQRILQHQRQQLRRGRAAQDRPAIAGGQQVGQAADVVDVHVRHDQRLNRRHRKADLQLLGAGAVGRRLRALEQAAVDEHGAPVGQRQLVTGAGDAIHGAVVMDVHWRSRCWPIEAFTNDHVRQP